MMISRDEFLKELRLRQGVREILKKLISERGIPEVKSDFVLSEDRKLRKHVRKMILKEKVDFAPHGNTGINVLSDLLERILPVIERDYKSLTTSNEQRTAYRAHLVRSVQKGLESLRIVEPGHEGETAHGEEEEPSLGKTADELEEAESEFDKFIDITGSPAVTDIDGDGVPDEVAAGTEDLTGRNFGAKTYDKIEQNISDSFSVLANPKDEDMFTDYLLTNLKLYFDKYEDELQGVVSEPSTEEYEDEKAKADSEELGGDELGGEEELGSPDDLGGEEEDDDIDITL
jgi:hypothetical protein